MRITVREIKAKSKMSKGYLQHQARAKYQRFSVSNLHSLHKHHKYQNQKTKQINNLQEYQEFLENLSNNKIRR